MSTPSLLNLITSIGHAQTHFEQLVHIGSIIFIDASFNSIASSGQIPTQQPQKSHLSGSISIISLPFLAILYIRCAASFRCLFFKLNIDKKFF